MKNTKTVILICTIGLLGISFSGAAQSSVFGLYQSDRKLADKHFEEGDFQSALNLYNGSINKRKSSKDLYLRIAQCYYSLKEYKKAIDSYDSYSKEGDLPAADLLNYGEASAAVLNYRKATDYYKKYLRLEPKNEVVAKKIWRLDNKQYLYEDSAHYALRPVALNTTQGELCAVPYKNGVVFMSNREPTKIVKNVNASVSRTFYELYFSETRQDSIATSSTPFQFDKAFTFGKGLDSKFNTGPVAFYDKEKKVAFIATSHVPNDEGKRTLGLYFAVAKNSKWEVSSSFTHNSEQYSIYDVTINQDGTIIFFSSDRKGGYGGKDLYKSELKNGLWSSPQNLGEEINTPKDEAYPFLHNNYTLYFSSNGLAGLGELDVFKSIVKSDGMDEPQNVGYPINSSKDDFGFLLDSAGTHGYLSSNRKNGGYDDDLYEFDMDLQTYPITISGVVKYKEHTWSEDTQLKIMPRGKIYLVDDLRNVSVYGSVSDAKGNFSIVIPYFSRYFIRIVGAGGDEHKASLEILKYRKELSSYEIVIIKDLFTK
ncbi:MAG: tetratricopeptide repeat protein [Cyclobacteriaceae bacterium]|nr:tetratricopeptide repeat protein [Cyclobacteriaceae bacterium]